MTRHSQAILPAMYEAKCETPIKPVQNLQSIRQSIDPSGWEVMGSVWEWTPLPPHPRRLSLQSLTELFSEKP